MMVVVLVVVAGASVVVVVVVAGASVVVVVVVGASVVVVVVVLLVLLVVVVVELLVLLVVVLVVGSQHSYAGISTQLPTLGFFLLRIRLLGTILPVPSKRT